MTSSELAPLLGVHDARPNGGSTSPPGSETSHFGLSAFLSDIQDPTNGTVPITILIAFVIGVLCGVCAYLYHTLLNSGLDFIWRLLPAHVFAPHVSQYLHWLWIPLVVMTCASLVGLSIVWLGDPGGLDDTIQCVHEQGCVPASCAPAMAIASQLSMVSGASVGPEAPLVAICAALAGWVSRTLFRQRFRNVVRKHTLCGMASALSAFFGAPIGGALFALEINNRLGHEYFEHALAAMFSGIVSLVVFRSLAGLEVGPIWQIAPKKFAGSSPLMIVQGAAFGLVGAGIGALFAHGHWAVMARLRARNMLEKPVALALLGGVGICVIGVAVPQTLFWGEFEFQTVAALQPTKTLEHIWPKGGLTGLEMTGFLACVIVGFAKLAAISVSVAGGYRGGFIFPLFLAGAAFGRAFVFLFPSLSPVLATLSVAAGINVTITRTALATPIILCALAGEPNALPCVFAASLVAALTTVYMPFIRSQRARADVLEAQLHSYTFQTLMDQKDTEDGVMEDLSPSKSSTVSILSLGCL